MGHNGLGTLALGFLLLLFLTATLAVICYPILVRYCYRDPKTLSTTAFHLLHRYEWLLRWRRL